MVAVVDADHELNQHAFLTAEQFQSLTVLTYPIEFQQTDLYTLFLKSKKVKPRHIKRVHNSHMMLQMIAADMGVGVLPDWVAKSQAASLSLRAIPMGEHGIQKTLVGRYDPRHPQSALLQQFLSYCQQEFAKLYGG